MSKRPSKSETEVCIVSNTADRFASVLRGVLGAIPTVGPLLAEVTCSLIPQQKLDRMSAFVQRLDALAKENSARISVLEERFRTEEGLDLLEESMTQAVRAVSDFRRVLLAQFIFTALTQNEMKYGESKKLLNLFRELTDQEVLILCYYVEDPYITPSQRHSRLRKEHPELFKLYTSVLGNSQEEIDQGALQKSYYNTLIRLGLLEEYGTPYSTTELGKLMLRYMDVFPSDEG